MDNYEQNQIKYPLNDFDGLLKSVAYKWRNVEDAYSECLLTYTICLHKFDPSREIAFTTYLYASLQNNLAHKWAIARKIPFSLSLDRELESRVPSHEDETADRLDCAEKLALVPPRERALLVRWINGETYQEIGDTVGLGRSRVHQLVSRARDIIKAA